jgi:hypothetical protein
LRHKFLLDQGNEVFNMNKGTILRLSKKRATIFTQDCQLVAVPRDPRMVVGKEIHMETKVKTNPEIVYSRHFKPAMIAASLVLLIAVILLFSQGLLFSPVYAQISIDVNPSLEMNLNRHLEVISVRAMNEEAVRLMANQNFNGLPWQQAVERWTEILRASNQVQVQNMLISAVMPENAEQLRTQLMDMNGNSNQGALAGVVVRAIYTYDQALAKEANRNGLSIGRQMLLNQARVQNQNWDEKSIADAPLGELVQALLQNGEANQTRLTERATQSLSERATPASSTETNRETNRESGNETQQTTNQETEQTTNRVTNQDGTSTGTGSQYRNQETNQVTNQNSSENGTAAGSGTRQTSQVMNPVKAPWTNPSKGLLPVLP